MTFALSRIISHLRESAAEFEPERANATLTRDMSCSDLSSSACRGRYYTYVRKHISSRRDDAHRIIFRRFPATQHRDRIYARYEHAPSARRSVRIPGNFLDAALRGRGLLDCAGFLRFLRRCANNVFRTDFRLGRDSGGSGESTP